MAVGLYGGAFNPVHHGHLVVAREVQSRCHLSRLIFLPAGRPPHKDHHDMAPVEHRVAMLRSSLDLFPDMELSRHETEKDRTCFSIDTVRYYREILGASESIVFIMGMDAFREIETWKEFDKFLLVSHLLVTTRASVSVLSEERIPNLGISGHLITVTGNELLEVEHSPCGSLIFMEIPDIDIAARDIRQRIGRGLPVDHLCPPPVHHYIRKHNLYTGVK